MKRREFVAATAIGSALSVMTRVTPSHAGVQARVLAFIPSEEKSHNLEKRIAAAAPSLDFTVFGRAKDLEVGVSQLNPEAVLAPEPTLRDLGLSPSMKGKRSGATTEAYVLVTLDRAIPPSEMVAHTVGALGIMGHASMRDLCGRLLGTSGQKIKTVTKYEDLLPLLQFGAAKGVLLPRRFASALTSRTALQLVVSDIPGGQVGLVSVAIKSQQAKSAILSSIGSLNAGAREALGVEGWE